jgi:hypothetical protein
MATDPKLAMARGILSDEWQDAELPPRRERGSSRRRSTVGLPEWMWRDLDTLARASGLSRDEVVMLVIHKFFQERERAR